MSHTYQHAILDIDAGVARFTMNRPESLNALSAELKADFTAMLDTVEGNSDVRALILGGAGRAFSAGGDVKTMEAKGQPPHFFRDRVASMHSWMKRLYNLDCPVIAEVNGLAYGGGFALAMAADFVLASDKARFCAVFGRIGLIPDMALIYTLPRAIGTQRAKELMFTARSISAQEAQDLGIVMSVHSDNTLREATEELAKRLASGPPQAISTTKRMVNRVHESDYDTMADMEANGQAMMHETEFHREAVRRFTSKEPSLYNWDEM